MRRSLNYYHKNIFIKLYEKFLHNFTDFFICNSVSAKKNLIYSEGVSKNKVKVIFNYINKNNKINLKKKKFKKVSRFFILLISTNIKDTTYY